MNPTDYRPEFDYEFVDDVLVIYDFDKRGRPVTTGLSDVLTSLTRSLNHPLGPVLYRDNSRVFEGVRHRDGRFQGFYPINETVLDAALMKARARSD